MTNSERVKRFREKHPERWAEIQRESRMRHIEKRREYEREYKRLQRKQKKQEETLA